MKDFILSFFAAYAALFLVSFGRAGSELELKINQLERRVVEAEDRREQLEAELEAIERWCRLGAGVRQ